MTKSISLFCLAICTYVSTLSGQITNTERGTYTANQLKNDLQYLRVKLESNHPGLYLYTSKHLIDQTFDSLANSLSEPMTAQAFYKAITIISPLIKDGHTNILPSAQTTDYHFANSKYLPYHVIILDNKLYIDMNYTAHKSIPLGAEISSINEIAASDIIAQLMARQVRDGNNLTYPTWILNRYFRQYYSFIFGHPDSYKISFKVNTQTSQATIKALPMDSIYYYRQKNYPNKVFTDLPNEGIKLKIENAEKYAILTIKDFHNHILKTIYKQNFKKAIASYFKQISKTETEHLIIDLRDNQGGDIENGVFLLSHLLDKPFSIVKAYFKLKDNQLHTCNGPSLGQHKLQANTFKGKVYVLINGGSFSNSGIVSSCLKANDRAMFIGQETGGNPNVVNGFTKDITLPNTKIQVQVPCKQLVMTDKTKNTGHGLMPTVPIQANLTTILEDKDTVLEYTIDLIRKSH